MARSGLLMAAVGLGMLVPACASKQEDLRQLNVRRHEGHDHRHGQDCGHTAVRHGKHVDYLHDGHLHHVVGDVVYEHALEEREAHLAGYKAVDAHHEHGPRCGHKTIPHGDHMDFVVDGRLHHVSDGHCDDHGAIKVVEQRP